MTCSFLHRIRQLLEFLVELTHMEAVHQGVVDLDVDGHELSSVLLEEFAEDDAHIGIGGDGGGLDDLGRYVRFLLGGVNKSIWFACMMTASSVRCRRMAMAVMPVPLSKRDCRYCRSSSDQNSPSRSILSPLFRIMITD